MKTSSIEDSRYFLIFVDDYSRKVFVYFLESKNQVTNSFKEYKAFVEKHSDYRIKILRSDNGREYINQRLLKFFKDNNQVLDNYSIYTAAKWAGEEDEPYHS